MSETGGREELVETLLRWSLDEASSTAVVRDAAAAVAQGETAAWILQLACLPLSASVDDVEDALASTPADLGARLVPRGNREAVAAVGLAMVRRCVAGDLAERDLTRWAHAVIGHSRVYEFEGLVSLEHSYDVAECGGGSTEAVDARVRTEAVRLAGHLYP